MRTAAARTKENGCELSLFKTPLRNPLRTPARNGMLSSATLNDLASYSNSNTSKHLKFIGATSMNDLQMCSESTITPIRFNKNNLTTPISTQRRALGLVNHNSIGMCRTISIDDLSKLTNAREMTAATANINKCDESMVTPVLTAIGRCSHPDNDDDTPPLPPHNIHVNQDTFDDLIPTNERIERMIENRVGGVNFFNHYDGIENTIRCQSPACSYINISTLLDMGDSQT